VIVLPEICRTIITGEPIDQVQAYMEGSVLLGNVVSDIIFHVNTVVAGASIVTSYSVMKLYGGLHRRTQPPS